MKCFLASNSAEGFVSYFGESYNPVDHWRAYIIKGGPGTGKSSFLKRVISRAEEKGLLFDEVYCASDPYSLDGVIIPKEKIVLLDGTAPHIVEPKFPGAYDKILNFGDFWREDILRTNGRCIIELTLHNKALHTRASGFVGLAGQRLNENLKAQKKALKVKEIKVLSDKIFCENLKGKGAAFKTVNRFLGGITPKGLLYFEPPIAKKTILLSDNVGTVSNLLFEFLTQKADSSGFETIVFRNPILPNSLVDGLYFPEREFCIVRNFYSSKERCETILAKDYLKGRKSRVINENDAFIKEYLFDAAKVLRMAKNNHDLLEEKYISAMDYAALNEFTDKVLEEVF